MQFLFIRFILKQESWIELDLLFEVRDLWIGVYWKKYPAAIEFYIGIIPIFIIRLYIHYGV